MDAQLDSLQCMLFMAHDGQDSQVSVKTNLGSVSKENLLPAFYQQILMNLFNNLLVKCSRNV